MGKTLGRAMLLALALSAGTVGAEEGKALPPVEVFAPPVCLACIDWAEHLRQNGFVVTLQEIPDMAALKKRLKVPLTVVSVHTARVGPYFVEGHVPADDIKQLLKEMPKARGLAVPGLPAGAPGRESSNPTCETACTVLAPGEGEKEVRREMYETLLVGPDGKTKVFARH